MGKTRPSLHPDNLTVSRIHVVLRPFETKLNALARTLERRVAKDTFAPKSRQPGVTYAKRHRIRAMTGMSSRQAGRAYVLEKKKGLSTLYSFHEQVIGVEDAFSNLVKGIPTPDQQRIPTLRGIIAKKIGDQVAEETMRDKEELEAEGIVDCIGLWYGELPVYARKDALVAHAVQLLELKIPVFILELWEGLLSVTLQARLHRESGTLLEHILLGYFTPFKDEKHASDCPAASASGRDLTDLYKRYTAHLPPADFFSVFLPILDDVPTAVWNFRCVSHLLRHLDSDIVLTARFLECMAGACLQAASDSKADRWVVELLETKAYGFLRSIIEVGHNSLGPEEIREMDHLTSMMMLIRLKWAEHDRIDEIALALNTEVLLQATEHHAAVDVSDIVSRLSNLPNASRMSDPQLLSVNFSALFSVCKISRESFSSFMDPYLSTFRKHRLFILADRLMQLMDKHSNSKGASPIEFDIQSLKRRRKLVQSRNKRRKLENGSYSSASKSRNEESGGGQDEDSDESDSDSTSEWDNSASGEDTAGEVVSDDDLVDSNQVHNNSKPTKSNFKGKNSREHSYRVQTSESRSTTTRYSTATGDDGEWKEDEDEDEDDEQSEEGEDSEEENGNKTKTKMYNRRNHDSKSQRQITGDSEEEETSDVDEISRDHTRKVESLTEEEEEEEDQEEWEQEEDEDQTERSITPQPQPRSYAASKPPKISTPRRNTILSPGKNRRRLAQSFKSETATDTSSLSDSQHAYDGHDYDEKFSTLPLTYNFAPPRLQSVLMSKVGARVNAGYGSRATSHMQVPIHIPTPVKQVKQVSISDRTSTRHFRSMPSSDDDLDLLGQGSSP